VRFVVVVLGTGPEWWGVVVLALGAVSAVMGVLYALMEHDLKRLLAFSTIENVGIILLGVGAAMLAGVAGLTTVAVLALAAALLHALNHATIKGLLFLAAGSVQHAAGTRDLNRLGGLVHVLPVTTLAFGLGAAAMAGLPVLNGFAGEWLTFQGLLGLGSATLASPLARSAALLGAGALGLTAALALAAFVKATGTGFLALPRSEGAAAAHEGGRTMRAGMALLGAACVVGGLAAGPLTTTMTDLASHVTGTGATPVAWSIGAPGIGGSGYGPLPLALVLGLVFALVWAAGSRGRAVRRAPTWTCGIVPEPAFEYTSTSFGKLIRLYFGRVLLPAREVSVELHPGTPFPKTVRYRGSSRQVIDERLYLPLQRGAVAAAQLARRVQNGSLQLYLAYTVLALVLLLLVARP
jgi:hydrogenase-4 component B